MRARGSVAVFLAGSSFAAAWLAAAPALPDAGGASLQAGPYVSPVADTTADVRFELAQPAPARIEIRPVSAAAAPPLLFEAPAAALHDVHATGLQAATPYAYDVRVAGARIASGRFSTAPAPGSTAPVTFLAYGDDRTDASAHASVVHAMLGVPAEFLVNTGDMVQNAGAASQWRSFFEIEAPLLRERPLFVAIGNHELVDDRAGANFARYFGFAGDGTTPRLYGTVRYGLLRFFFLNAMDDWSGGEERQWLERQLSHAEAEAGVVWRIVVVHDGPWSVGPHGPNLALLRAGIPAALAAHRVDLVLAGHDHIYDRGMAGAIKYIVTGGGGAPLYDIERDDPTARKTEVAYHFVEITASPDRIGIVAHRVDGSVIDRCGFAPGQPWDCDPARPSIPAPVAPRQTGATSGPPTPGARCGCSTVGTGGGPRWSLGTLIGSLGIGAGAAGRRRRGRSRRRD